MKNIKTLFRKKQCPDLGDVLRNIKENKVEEIAIRMGNDILFFKGDSIPSFKTILNAIETDLYNLHTNTQ